MALKMAVTGTFDFALRALQVVFAIIVMGTDGYGTEKQYILLCRSTVESDRTA